MPELKRTARRSHGAADFVGFAATTNGTPFLQGRASSRSRPRNYDRVLDGTTKLRALVRTATGCDVSCDLAEFKSGGLGCSSGDTKVLGHACAHLVATANKSGKNIEEFYPQHKTTAHLKAMFTAGGQYPTPPDQETIAQHKEKFDANKHIARVLKAKTGRKKRRHKGGKDIAMEKKARKATRAKAR